jgi:hypothetical protein
MPPRVAPDWHSFRIAFRRHRPDTKRRFAVKDEADKSADTPLSDASPYGPQHGHIDEASGGADSSPFESMSSDERADALRRARQGQGEAPAP